MLVFSTTAAMVNRAPVLSGMKVVVMMLMILGKQAETMTTERGFGRPPLDPLPTYTQVSGLPQKAFTVSPSQYLKRWLLSVKAAGLDGTTKAADKTTTKTVTDRDRASRPRIGLDAADPDKRSKMLKMISSLEELQRAFTLGSQITIIPRANGKNSGRKNKVLPAAEGAVKPTTSAPAVVDSTASADVDGPSLTGRNFRKSLPPQAKKTNKRVCFWKYCSQN
ncbi:urotensin II-related peptide [Mugil cephalus]|uniref:urotensin II-related peptide n=1 Tax=Mugil cephalus TaxID=48193 RepID=UPI001FB62FC1|nr:urotensin II-related peptide [Mugil cephalus]